MSTNTEPIVVSNHNSATISVIDAETEPVVTNSAAPLLTVADFNGDGQVDIADLQDIAGRNNSSTGDDNYHVLYDLNADGAINGNDLVKAIETFGADVPLLDRQIAQATQATMKYYGAGGQENAIADGYIPATPEAMGHGVHYYNFALAEEIANAEEIDLERPVGLNYDLEGNLIAVYYIRVPDRLEATPENPLAPLLIDPADNFPPTSFDTLTADDWHTHESAWATGIGSLNSESVYFEENVPFELVVSRLQENNFQLFPESDQFYLPGFFMLHGWFHTFNPEGTFAITNPDVAPYAIEELGVHGGHGGHEEHSGEHNHHQEFTDTLITGTDYRDSIVGTEQGDRMNGFNGDDWMVGRAGDDSIWGGHGNDWIEGDHRHYDESGDDMLYGGPGNDLIWGHQGSDRLFGGTDNDILEAGEGDDLLRGGLGNDIVTGGAGADSFVLVSGEGTDIITDLELELDTIILYGGITTEGISLTQLDNNTAISFKNETLAIVSGINANDFNTVQDDIFLVA